MRTTRDPKPNRVVIRINDEDKEYLRREVSSRGMSISDYIRELIENAKKSNHK